MCMRMASIPPLPGLTTIAALTPPGASPCPPSGKLWKGSTGSARLQFQIRVSFFLYGCWTSGVCMRMASIPPLPGLTILAALTPPGATPFPPSGKPWKGSTSSARPQIQNRVSFFLYGCWTSLICMRIDSKTPLPGLTTLTPQMPPGAIPCPVSGNLWKGSTGSAGPHFQKRFSFFLYGWWTSGVCMRMASIPPLPGLTTLAALTPPGATPCPLLLALYQVS